VTSAFKQPGSKANIDDILKPAMAAGNHCTAFDTNGYLPNLYGKYGYRPIVRVAFDPALAPEGWKPEMGKPDVVVMVRDPDGATGAPQLNNDYQDKKDQIPVVSYDKAVQMQKEAVGKNLVRLPKESERKIHWEEHDVEVDDSGREHVGLHKSDDGRFEIYAKYTL
jgi:hypothetical protein